MSTFTLRQPGLYPTALRGPWGTAWGAAFGAEKDIIVTYAKLAVKSGFVLLAPEDALERHGRDVSLEQLPGETSTAYRTRIAGAWDTWPWAGTRAGLETVFTLLGLTVRLATAAELGRTPWAQWWAFATGTGWTRRTWKTGSEFWGSGVWGSTATRDDVRRIRRFARQFSNARDRGWVVILQSSPGVWGAPSTWGAPGVWGARNPRWRV